MKRISRKTLGPRQYQIRRGVQRNLVKHVRDAAVKLVNDAVHNVQANRCHKAAFQDGHPTDCAKTTRIDVRAHHAESQQCSYPKRIRPPVVMLKT
jgi:hypothetical protein